MPNSGGLGPPLDSYKKVLLPLLIFWQNNKNFRLPHPAAGRAKTHDAFS
jgi:hypothetical protein